MTRGTINMLPFPFSSPMVVQVCPRTDGLYVPRPTAGLHEIANNTERYNVVRPASCSSGQSLTTDHEVPGSITGSTMGIVS
jgi:uncharacterized protein YbbK (DUF523 family)